MSNEARARAKRKFVKRAPNYSVNEKRFIVERILNTYPVILDKRVDNRTKKEKTRAWELLAAEFNSQGGFNDRTPTTLRTCWENLKRLKKNECVTSVLEPHLAPKKQNSVREECEVIDLEEPNDKEKDEENDTKERKMMVEVKIDEDVIFIPDTEVDNCEQENNVTDQTNNMDPLSEIAENIDPGNTENADCNSVAHAPKDNNEPAKEAKKKAAKRLHVITRRPVNVRNAFVRKEIELFQTLKKHAEQYGKMLAMKKMELFQTLQLNAEEEGKIKRLILEEQLKQEKIKTVKMESLV